MEDPTPYNVSLNTSGVIRASQSLLQDSIAVLAGSASSGRKELILSAGRILQATISGDLLKQLQEEWDSFKAKGKIKQDYEQTPQHKSLLSELFKYLDQDIPSEIIFRSLKQIFIIAATEVASNRDDLEPTIYAKLIRRISPEAILVLNACFQSLDRASQGNVAFPTWVKVVSEKSGIKNHPYIELCEKELIEVKLLHPRHYLNINVSHTSAVDNTHFGLTDMGLSLCHYVANYEAIVRELSAC